MHFGPFQIMVGHGVLPRKRAQGKPTWLDEAQINRPRFKWKGSVASEELRGVKARS